MPSLLETQAHIAITVNLSLNYLNMFERKLKSLGYHQADKFNVNDENDFRNLVSWLEDQKIRNYSIDDRADLRDFASTNWNDTFAKYLKDIACPFDPKEKIRSIDWLLLLSLRLEYQDNYSRYNSVTSDEVKKNLIAPSVVQANPLDNLDFNSSEFINGVNEIADLLKIPKHPNHLITLEAIAIIIKSRFSGDALECKQTNQANLKSDKVFTIENSHLGFDGKDQILTKAAKVLRILYINDLRDLQTKINHIIVSIQSITANPKTDTSLGKVGR